MKAARCLASGPRRFGILAVVLCKANFLGKTDLGEQPDAIVVGVDFVPGKAMLSGDGMGVVIVMPALAATHQRNPPVVARVVAGLKSSAAPHVSSRVHQPRCMKAERHTQESSPQYPADGAGQPTCEPAHRNNTTPLAVSGIQ